MKYMVSIYWRKPGQDWDSLTTQTFLSFQAAMKEGQTLMKETRREHDARITKFVIDEIA